MRNIVAAPIPPALAEQAITLVREIQAGRGNAGELTEVIGQMTEAVLNHFFVAPVAAIGVGAPLKRVVDLGVGGAVRGLRYGLNKIVPRLKPPQLRQLADFIDRSLLEVPQS